MTTENYSDLLNQAEQAFANQDPRKGMTCVLHILNNDFTNDPAWQLLYRIVKPKQPFEVFQMELANKHFPDKVHLLMEKEFGNLLQGATPPSLENPQGKPSGVETRPAVLEGFNGKEDKNIQQAAEPHSKAMRQDALASSNINLSFCPQCGQARSADIRFCIQCGFDFSAGIHKKAERARQEAAERLPSQAAQQKQPRQGFIKGYRSAAEAWQSSKPSKQTSHKQAWLVGALGLLLLCILGIIGLSVFAIPKILPYINTVHLPAANKTTGPDTGSNKIPNSTTLPTQAKITLPASLRPINVENAASVGALATWGKGVASAIVVSPDGKLIAVAATRGIYLYDANTLNEVLWIETGFWVTCVAFSPDGRMLASGSMFFQDKTVKLWRVSDGSLLRTLEGHLAGVTTVAFSPDGQTLASGGGDGMRLWRVSDGVSLWPDVGLGNQVYGVMFSPDGEMLASGGDDGVRLWRVSDGAQLRTLESQSGQVSSVAFSPDGQILASVTEQKVLLWRVSDGTTLRAPEGSDFTHVAFSPDGQILASTSTSGGVQLWRVSDWKVLRTIGDQGKTFIDSNWIGGIAFLPDGQTLVYMANDGSVQLRKTSDGALQGVIEGHTAILFSMAFSPDRQILASGSYGGTIQLWRVSDGTVLQTLKLSSLIDDIAVLPLVSAIAFSPDGQLLASASYGSTLRLWRVSDGSLVRSWKDGGFNVAFSPDGQLLASGSGMSTEDKTVNLWRVSDGSLLRTLEGHTSGVLIVAFSSDGQTLASTSSDRTVRLWRVSDGTLLRTLEVDNSEVYSLAFSPDGQTIAFTGETKTLQLWLVSDGTLLRTFEGDTYMRGVSFSPDGQILASGMEGGVTLWRVSDGTLLRKLEGHYTRINSVSFSSDGKLLASTAEDGLVKLWGVP